MNLHHVRVFLIISGCLCTVVSIWTCLSDSFFPIFSLGYNGPWLLWNINRKSQVADRYVSVPMTLKGGMQWVNFFQADLLNNARTV